MNVKIEPAILSYAADGRLYSPAFDDVYFQPEDGVAESSYVFLQHNNLEERFKGLRAGDVFRIAECGFGSGLNFLLTLDLWRRTASKGARLYYLSFEKHPVQKTDMKEIHAYWPDYAAVSQELLTQYPAAVKGFHRLDFGSAQLQLCLGDITEMLPQIKTQIDAWYLDGFAPAKNPAMWREELFRHMARLSVQGSTVSTFTAAGTVKRGLQAAGFHVEKTRGYGKKRDMLTGTYQRDIPKTQTTGSAIVIGAGIAGASCAYALAARGMPVTVLEKAGEAGNAASGNPVGVVYPRLTAAVSAAGDFYTHAFCHTTRILARLENEKLWRNSSVLMLDGGDAAAAKRYTGMVKSTALPEEMLRPVDRKQATEIAGIPLASGGLYYPDAGLVAPREFCTSLLEAFPAQVTLRSGAAAEKIMRQDGVWHVLDAAGEILAEAEHLVLATGPSLTGFSETDFLPLRYVGGQISYLPENAASRKLKAVITQDGYFPPAVEGVHYTGATFEKLRAKAETHPVTEKGHRKNLTMLGGFLPAAFFDGVTPEDLQGRAGIRTSVPDHLPVVGKCPVAAQWLEDYAGLSYGQLTEKQIDLDKAEVHDGLYLCGAFGSHGMTSAPLAGEMIAAQICGDPLPVSEKVAAAIHPGRFILRALKRNQS
ncbi:MAG: bifunctional tRNA (5-methylaminomethyl-2-thiouridine)(34)-methyltransferase MnmD/FAD-dependent 5-carboxymethylaminomethyl-2-thiouridine(34) oxidoreductase MnmC [Pseudomonadota bacterium]|nr:bifunctional tRNA (5-methylaminomethyl-2-thiouridine)(34)-methyltransferase MnmD/FAD-dependent 5-carboxymethylaminomethyl-2-thiouridine(34) oxidoreductase MnmC [Pseudomonadota bacterium]QKK05730.1 MAG: bifunctional tRNA (5-methylaminomethyl-2-thiouridine)(34)-methyltransferase MnmD/FAD-dependent 5-carboxymethylaminomethyl-2-thiouridine(34) oxidoreductase MnmC [Pseudomonadota bacterium]